MDLKKLPLFGKPKFLQVPSEDPEEGIIPTKPRVTRVPWLTALLTVICIALAFLFQIRWAQPISQWPIDLPMRRYTFVDHPSLRDFDDAAAGDRWGGMVWKKWWNTEWRDNTGRRFPRGIDVFHKMHCIIAIREEFAKLATNEARDEAFQPRDEAEDEKFKLEFNRNHLEHCFDFLRQDILCAADMTLEPLDEEYVETDGQGVEHECRDWRLLLDHMGLPDVDS